MALHKLGHQIFYWHGDDTIKNNFIEYARVAISEFFKMDELTTRDGIKLLRTSEILRPLYVRQKYRDFQLNRIVKKYGISDIINADFQGLTRPDNLSGKYIYDYVDDPVGFPGNSIKHKITYMQYLAKQISQCDHLLAASSSLTDQIVRDWNIPKDKVTLVPNGVWVKQYQGYRSYPPNEIKKKYHIPEGKIISFIGNHSEWTGIDFLLNLFRRHRRRLNGYILLLVGPTYRPITGESNVFNVGVVPWDDIPALIQISECGVLPFNSSPFTENALPLKIVEYTAMNKPVIATPLEQLYSLNWPNIFLVPQDTEAWLEAITTLHTRNFATPDIRNYDWNVLAHKVNRILLDDIYWGSQHQSMT